ncbi:hypothetical protein [Aquimarina aquimarini]|uniref:hypothetical protein n=1 Tax=Aquimarina aquimarini TaxID=1191734 RepID=UPI000D54C767|nr:hypothetical protein [Aquimarina aquimarini]
MNKVTKNILKYLIELIIVTFGVFLGVYFSNINAENKTKADKEKMLEIIVKELEYNQELLKEYIDYHEELKIQIDSIVPSLRDENRFSPLAIDNKFQFNKIKGWKGFQFARLQKTAFEGAKISGILKEFDIELIQKISSSYELQDTYIDFGTSILNKAIDMNSSTKVIDVIGIITLTTSDLLNMEKGLSQGLEKTIAELKTLRNN